MYDQAHVARLQRLIRAAAMGVHVHPRVILFPPVPDDSLSQNYGWIQAFYIVSSHLNFFRIYTYLVILFIFSTAELRNKFHKLLNDVVGESVKFCSCTNKLTAPALK